MSFQSPAATTGTALPPTVMKEGADPHRRQSYPQSSSSTGTTARSVGWPGEVSLETLFLLVAKYSFCRQVNLKVTSAGVEHTLHVPNGVTFEDATDAFLKEKNLEHLMNKKDGIVAKLIEMVGLP